MRQLFSYIFGEGYRQRFAKRPLTDVFLGVIFETLFLGYLLGISILSFRTVDWVFAALMTPVVCRDVKFVYLRVSQIAAGQVV
jgi:hypothetical protein